VAPPHARLAQQLPLHQRRHEPVYKVGVAQAAGHLGHRVITCLPCAPGVECAARCHGCRVGCASGNGGDGCLGKVLRVHARRHQPVLPVVEAQSTLRSYSHVAGVPASDRAHTHEPMSERARAEGRLGRWRVRALSGESTKKKTKRKRGGVRQTAISQDGGGVVSLHSVNRFYSPLCPNRPLSCTPLPILFLCIPRARAREREGGREGGREGDHSLWIPHSGGVASGYLWIPHSPRSCLWIPHSDGLASGYLWIPHSPRTADPRRWVRPPRERERKGREAGREKKGGREERPTLAIERDPCLLVVDVFNNFLW
jgi:hypothetical protein